MYAQGIVTLFPHLEDPYSQHGYVSKGVIGALGPHSVFAYMMYLYMFICIYVGTLL